MNSPNARRACNSTEPTPTAGALLAEGARRLESAGADSPRLAAELLLAHALGCDRCALLARPERGVGAAPAGVYADLVRRRAAREPLQHLLGRTEFWSLTFLTDPRALIPRPETELLVEAALALATGVTRTGPPIALAEIGTGTGCVALALARELPGAEIVASDLSTEALALAEENARLHGLSGRVRFIAGDMTAPYLAEGLGGRFDAALSNPPYIPTDEIERLQPEGRDHDPGAALDGGPDGLDAVRRLLAGTPPLLRPGGALMIEIGAGQSDAVRRLAAPAGWRVERVLPDPQGIDRVVQLRRA